MTPITLDDVIRYLVDDVADPDRRRQIELARDNDPQVRACFEKMQQVIDAVATTDTGAYEEFAPWEALTPEAAAELTEMSAAAARSSPLPMPPAARRPFWTRDLRRAPLATSALSFSDTEVSDQLPPGEVYGLSQDQRSIVIRCPVENSEGLTFPYRVALVEYWGDDGMAIASRLMPVSRNDVKGVFQARIAVKEIVPEGLTHADAGGLHLWEVTEDLQELPRELGVADVQRVLDDRFVSLEPKLRKPIERLKQQIEERRADNE